MMTQKKRKEEGKGKRKGGEQGGETGRPGRPTWPLPGLFFDLISFTHRKKGREKG